MVPLIGVVTAYIAWQQHKTNKNQFRLALFERRLKVFNASAQLIVTVLRRARVETDDLVKFQQETRESDFLFGPDIASYLDFLYRKAVDVGGSEDAIDEETKNQRLAARKWFTGRTDELKEKFGKYMAFREGS
jgi:hypothetical protein